jgi:hypothetical protein
MTCFGGFKQKKTLTRDPRIFASHNPGVTQCWRHTVLASHSAGLTQCCCHSMLLPPNASVTQCWRHSMLVLHSADIPQCSHYQPLCHASVSVTRRFCHQCHVKSGIAHVGQLNTEVYQHWQHLAETAPSISLTQH